MDDYQHQRLTVDCLTHPRGINWQPPHVCAFSRVQLVPSNECADPYKGGGGNPQDRYEFSTWEKLPRVEKWRYQRSEIMAATSNWPQIVRSFSRNWRKRWTQKALVAVPVIEHGTVFRCEWSSHLRSYVLIRFGGNASAILYDACFMRLSIRWPFVFVVKMCWMCALGNVMGSWLYAWQFFLAYYFAYRYLR